MNAATSVPDPLSALISDRVFATVRASRIDDAGALPETLVAGGIRVIELALTTPKLTSLLGGAAEAASRTGAVVGSETVCTAEQAREAIEAGARFITPGSHRHGHHVLHRTAPKRSPFEEWRPR